MKRVAVVGNSGAGKSTIARRLARHLDVPLLELDSVFHLPGWAELDLATFRSRVAEFVAQEQWIVDGNYRDTVGDLVWERADTVLWLDLPRYVVICRVIGRTLRRAVTGQELWNGNRERWRDLLRWDPQRSIIRWSWTQHRQYREQYAALAAEATHTDTRVVRLTSQAQVDRWQSGLGQVAK